MGKSYQIVKVGLTIVFVILNLFGLWPFRFVHHNKQIKYSVLKAIYSIFLVIFGTMSYQVVGSIAFNSGDKAFLGSFTLRFVLLIYAQSVIISVIFAYLGVHWFSKDIENVYRKWMDLVNEISDSVCDIDLSGCIFKISMRMIVLEVVVAIASYAYMTKMDNSTDIIKSSPYLVLLLQLTPYTARLHINIFYCLVIAAEVVVRIMNVHLDNTLTKATENVRNIRIRMCNYCHCSDELDRLSTLHSNLAEAIKAINSIFSVNVVLWATTVLLTLTVQFLNQAITIIEMSQKYNMTAIMFNVYGSISIFIASFDQLSLSNACQRLSDAAAQTSSILHSMRINHDVDERLRKSIDDFSMQMLLNKLQMRSVLALDSTSASARYGNMTTNRTRRRNDKLVPAVIHILIFLVPRNSAVVPYYHYLCRVLLVIMLVITTTVSYFVVLLQFELAERKVVTNLKTAP